MATEMVTLRPVTTGDVGALAELVSQLYHAEEPGVLRAPRAAQLRFFAHLVGHELAASTRGRFLAVAQDGTPLGSASVRLAGDPAAGPLPPGLFAAALRSVGIGDTLRFFGYLMRGSLIAETPLRRGECYIYSVIVHQHVRGRGVGTMMMEALEAYACGTGVHTALLRVMSSNLNARRLYERLGYRTIAPASAFARTIGVPSELMRKELR